MKKVLALLVAVLLSSSIVLVFADSTSFIDLCKTGGIAAVKSALTTGKIDVNTVTEAGKTALMSACENTTSSSLAIVGLLLNKGANVNATDSLGKTALDYAKTNTEYGQQISALLEKAGAVSGAVKTVKNSSATVSEMATSAATAAATKVATSEKTSTKEVATVATQAVQETAASSQKEEVKTSSNDTSTQEEGFFSKIKNWFSGK